MLHCVVGPAELQSSQSFRPSFFQYQVRFQSAHNPPFRWHIKKRYSEFTQFLRSLEEKNPSLKLPALPGKTGVLGFANCGSSESVTEVRRKAFQELFDAVCAQHRLLAKNGADLVLQFICAPQVDVLFVRSVTLKIPPALNPPREKKEETVPTKVKKEVKPAQNAGVSLKTKRASPAKTVVDLPFFGLGGDEIQAISLFVKLGLLAIVCLFSVQELYNFVQPDPVAVVSSVLPSEPTILNSTLSEVRLNETTVNISSVQENNDVIELEEVHADVSLNVTDVEKRVAPEVEVDEAAVVQNVDALVEVVSTKQNPGILGIANILIFMVLSGLLMFEDEEATSEYSSREAARAFEMPEADEHDIVTEKESVPAAESETSSAVEEVMENETGKVDEEAKPEVAVTPVVQKESNVYKSSSGRAVLMFLITLLAMRSSRIFAFMAAIAQKSKVK